MNPDLVLRAAAALSLLFAAGHALGGRKDWSPMGENDVLRAMRETPFETMGVRRTYLDFFRGFGHSLTVFLLLQTAILWQIANLTAANGSGVQPLIAMLAIASLVNTIISWFFLFPAPAIFGAVLTVLLAIATALAR